MATKIFIAAPRKTISKLIQATLVSWICVLLPAGLEQIYGQSNFYQGKTITYVVGLLAGDSNDLWARAVTRNMAKHIPGQPNIVVQNMPGAGGLTAANYVYGVAKPDGLTLGTLSAGHYFHQLAGRKEAQFDWRKAKKKNQILQITTQDENGGVREKFLRCTVSKVDKSMDDEGNHTDEIELIYGESV